MAKKLKISLYKYTGLVGKRQKKIKGILAAENKNVALAELSKLNINGVILKDKTPFEAQYESLTTNVKDTEIANFFEKLASQMEVGITPSRSLQNFMSEGFKYNTLLFIYNVKEELNKGHSIKDSMSFPGVLPKDIISLIDIGEKTGKVVDIFREISKLYNEQARIKKAIKKATYKPIGLISFAFAILIFIVPIMLEPIKSVQAQFDTKGGLPMITQIVMGVTNVLTHYWWIVLTLIIGSIIAQKYFYKTNFAFKERWDGFIFAFPIIGRFKKALAVYVTLLNLYILQRSGMPVAQSFKMISDSQKNEEFKKDIKEIRDSLKEGNSLEESMSYSSYIPRIYKDMIKQGETTGKMVEELHKAKTFAEKEFNETAELIISSFSKITSIFVSMLVGIIVLAVYMPIFSMVGQVMETM